MTEFCVTWPFGLSALLLHGHALALKSRCPSCAELLNHRALFQGAPCVQCGVTLAQRGFEASRFMQGMKRRGNKHLAILAGVLALSNLIIGWFPLLSSIMALLAAAWIRVGILYPMTIGLSPQRRLLTRFTARALVGLFLMSTFLISELLTLTPCVGVIGKAAIGVIQVFCMAWIVTGYANWQIRRSTSRATPALWEWSILLAIIASLLGMAYGLVLTIIWVLETIDSL